MNHLFHLGEPVEEGLECRAYIGIMEKKMETILGYIGIMERKMETILGYIGIMEKKMETILGYIGIMEKKMETTIVYWVAVQHLRVWGLH